MNSVITRAVDVHLYLEYSKQGPQRKYEFTMCLPQKGHSWQSGKYTEAQVCGTRWLK